MKVYYYFDEPVKVLSKRKHHSRIEFDDGTVDVVPTKDLVVRNVKPKPDVEKQKARTKKHFGDDERIIAIKLMPCCICGKIPSDNAHIKPRSTGGTFENNIVPLCRTHHIEQESMGVILFNAKYGVDLAEIAISVEKRLDNNL